MIRPEIAQTLVELQGLKTKEALSERARHTAERLETRLKTPLRVAIMGAEDAGKSTLLNYIAGGDVVPKGMQLPTLRASYSPHAHANCTLNDGTVLRMAKLDYDQILEKSPVFVDLRLPLPALRKITLLELVTRNDAAEQGRALAWAARRCDLAIWCSQTFAPQEQAVWNMAPEHLLDQSLLAMTKADLIDEDSQRAIRATAARRFSHVFPIDTLGAISARDANGHLDRDALARSGGLDLIRTLLREIDNGIATAHDSALVLLARHAQWAQRNGTRKSTALPAEEPSFEAPEGSGRLAEKEPGAGVDPRTRAKELLDSAKDHVIGQSDELLARLEAGEPIAAPEIFDACVSTMRDLLDMLGDASDRAFLGEIHSVVLEGADMIELLRAERGRLAVNDALTVLLQVKREMDAFSSR